MDFIDLKTPYAKHKSDILARMERVLEHGQYIMGPEVAELEARLAAYAGTDHCITVASGTEALLISLMALDIQPGDEVITTPFSFIATAEVIALVGAVPVFVDVEPDTANIAALAIEGAITPRTRAIMPVSLYGQPADMETINEIAARHGLPVIEDAAQSFGASYRGRRSCNLSTIGCTSFFPSKPLGCYGDGGAIFTNSGALAKAMREIRVHGQERRYFHTRLGVGGRMDTLQCAVVLAKLPGFEEEVEARRRIGERYSRLLADIPQADRLGLLAVRADRTSVHAQYTVRIAGREAFQAALKARGIPTAVHYPMALHQQPALASRSRVTGTLHNAERLAAEVVSLPMHPYLTAAQQDEVAGAVASALAP